MMQIYAQNIDLKILKDINGISQTVNFSLAISNTTTFVAFSTPATMAVVALFKHDDKLLKNAIYCTAAIGVDGVLTYSLKHIINRDRPPFTYPDEILAYQALYHQSMPSGHTSLAFATATSLIIKYPKWYVIVPSYLWACSVGYSRMNLGVHYPSDVLAGAVLGTASAWVSYKVNDWFWRKNENKKLLALKVYR